MSSKDGEIRLLLKEIKEGRLLWRLYNYYWTSFKEYWNEANIAFICVSVWVLGDAKYSVAGKQKYEQLVEIKLSLEMEIQTYRSILEDEEKRIRRSYLLFCLFLTSLGAVDMKIKTVRAMAFGIQDMKVDWTGFLTRIVMFCTLRWFFKKIGEKVILKLNGWI